MTAIGLQLQFRLSRHLAGPVGIGLGIKLLAAPLAVLAVCRLVDMKGLAVGVSIVEAGMPPMVTAGALAAVAGMEAELAIALVGIGILCSFGSLPVLHWLVTL
jgi:predicted permease